MPLTKQETRAVVFAYWIQLHLVRDSIVMAVVSLQVRSHPFSVCWLLYLVCVVQWDDSGIAIYFFPRQQIPSDITSGQPNPASWGLPNAKWPSSELSTFKES